MTYADISHARRVLLYKPRTPFRNGIEEFVSWYRKQNSTGERTGIRDVFVLPARR